MNREVTNTPLFIRYLKAYESNPRSIVFAPLAEGYRKAGMVEKAMDILKEGVKYHPSYITGYLGLASCYFDLSQYNLTYMTLRPLVGSNRDNIRLQKLFASACLKMEQNDEALQTYKYLLFINPKDKDTAYWVKQLEDNELNNPGENPNDDLISNPLQSEQNTFSVESLSTGPNGQNVDNWQQVDLTNKNVQRTSNKKEIEKEKSSQQNVPTYTLAQLYYQQGHLDKAKKILEKLIILNPEDLNVRRKLEEVKISQENKGTLLNLSSNKNSKKEIEDPVKSLEKKMGAFFQAIQNKANAYKQRFPEN